MTGPAQIFLAVSTLLVAIALMVGFVIIPSPAMQRIYNLDSKRVDALETLASAINVYVFAHKELPASLSDLNADVTWSVDASKDSETGTPFKYVKGQGFAYRLCADFERPSQHDATAYAAHPAGHYCEDRTATTAMTR